MSTVTIRTLVCLSALATCLAVASPAAAQFSPRDDDPALPSDNYKYRDEFAPNYVEDREWWIEDERQIDMGSPPIANVPYVSDFVYPDYDFGFDTEERREQIRERTPRAAAPMPAPRGIYLYTEDWWDDRETFGRWYDRR